VYKFIRNNELISFLLSLALLIYLSFSFFRDQIPTQIDRDYFFNFLEYRYILGVVFALGIIYVCYFLISFAVQIKIAKSFDFFTLFLFLCFVSILSHYLNLSMSFFILFFVVYLMRTNILILYSATPNEVSLFSLGFMVGLYLLFDLSVIYYIPVFFIVLSKFVIHKVKVFFSLFFGVLTPIYLLFSLVYLFDIPFDFEEIQESVFFHLNTHVWQLKIVFSLISLIFLVVLQNRMQYFNIKERNIFSLIASILLVNVFINFLGFYPQRTYIIILAMILSIYLKLYFEFLKKETLISKFILISIFLITFYHLLLPKNINL
jgi:hypothetical protein